MRERLRESVQSQRHIDGTIESLVGRLLTEVHRKIQRQRDQVRGYGVYDQLWREGAVSWGHENLRKGLLEIEPNLTGIQYLRVLSPDEYDGCFPFGPLQWDENEWHLMAGEEGFDPTELGEWEASRSLELLFPEQGWKTEYLSTGRPKSKHPLTTDRTWPHLTPWQLQEPVRKWANLWAFDVSMSNFESACSLDEDQRLGRPVAIGPTAVEPLPSGGRLVIMD